MRTSFFDNTRSAQSVLVIDLGFLGDTVHLIPALRCIREALPRADLDVMVTDHIKDVLELVPDLKLRHIWGYPRWPKGPKWYQDIPLVWKMRRERYEAIINLKGSDRSALLGWAIGAPYRLGRIPERRPGLLWKCCFTHTVKEPHERSAVFEQRYRCLMQAGFPDCGIRFDYSIPEAARESIDLRLKGMGAFIHLSPCTSSPDRELPLPELVALMERIKKERPEFAWIVSCSPTSREITVTKALEKSLSFPIERTFLGTLSIPEITDVIGRARLHIGADTGSIHLAMLTGTPSVSWFRSESAHVRQWLPTGPQHTAVFGHVSPKGLLSIDHEELFRKVDFALAL